MKSHFRSAVQTKSTPLRCFSGSAISTVSNVSKFLKFISSSTSVISRSHCLRSLWKIIETTNRIKVNSLNTFTRVYILMSRIARYTENDFALFRSKIRELHPVHRASLGALLRHLLCVARSDKNSMTLKVLAAQFRYAVLRGNLVLQEGVDMKACCN